MAKETMQTTNDDGEWRDDWEFVIYEEWIWRTQEVQMILFLISTLISTHVLTR